jgi:hypothetical protein
MIYAHMTYRYWLADDVRWLWSDERLRAGHGGAVLGRGEVRVFVTLEGKGKEKKGGGSKVDG